MSVALLLGAWLVGAFGASLLLELGAGWYHFRMYGTHSENWSILYTLPAGVLFGGLLAVRLLCWTLSFEETGRWPGGSRSAWFGRAVAGSLLVLVLLLALIAFAGRTLSVDQGYSVLCAAWFLALWIGRPPRV